MRVKLGLVVDPHGSVRGKGKRDLLDVRGGQAGVSSGLRLRLDVGFLGGRARVGVVRGGAEIAFDPQLPDDLEDVREPGLVRLGVGARALGCEPRSELRVDGW
jgi:hypothetical protein